MNGGRLPHRTSGIASQQWPRTGPLLTCLIAETGLMAEAIHFRRRATRYGLYERDGMAVPNVGSARRYQRLLAPFGSADYGHPNSGEVVSLCIVGASVNLRCRSRDEVRRGRGDAGCRGRSAGPAGDRSGLGRARAAVGPMRRGFQRDPALSIGLRGGSLSEWSRRGFGWADGVPARRPGAVRAGLWPAEGPSARSASAARASAAP